MVIFLDIFVDMNVYSNSKVKINVFLIFLFSGFILFSQEQDKTKLFDIEIQKKADQYKSHFNFYKSASFFLKKEWDSTLVYSMRGLNDTSKDQIPINYMHYFRGYSFQEKKIFNEAKKEYNLIDNSFDFYNVVVNRLGHVSLELNEFESAINYFQELANLPKDDYLYFNRGSVFHNLGLCYLHLNKFKQAEPHLIESLSIREKEKDTLKLIRAYGDIANLYYNQYKDNLAIPYFEKAYQLSKNIKDFDAKRITTINMAVVEENRKDLKKALAYRKEYEKWKDSLNDQNKIYEVAKLEKEFAVKEKQKEVSVLQAENKAKVIERNGLLYSVLTLLILLGTAIYFYRGKIKTNKIIVAQKESLDALNATKDKLFSIVSHDLRSSVNALKTSNTKLLDNLEAKNLDALDEQLHNNSAIVNGAYNLLDNLLHWALLQTNQSYFEITSVRLFSLVEQTVYNYMPLMQEKNIEFKNDILISDLVFADQKSF